MKESELAQQVDRLSDYRNLYHIFLVGMSLHQDNSVLKQYHAEILKFILQHLLKRGF